MKEDNKLATSQANLESSSRIYDNESLKASLVVCFDRLSIEHKSIDNLIYDIRGCYPDVKTKDITDAIKNGSMGIYGRTYRFSFQEVSIWIIEHQKSKMNKNLHLYQS